MITEASRVIDAGLKAALSEEDQADYEQIWVNDLQLSLAQLSKRVRRLVVPNSGHDMPTDRPDAIANAVRELCVAQTSPEPGFPLNTVSTSGPPGITGKRAPGPVRPDGS